MQRSRLRIAGIAGLLLFGASCAHATRLRDEPQRHAPYFVEFRARPGGAFGHTYVVYGEMDGRRGIRHVHFAGLYPSGPFSQSIFLAVLPTTAEIAAEPVDHTRRPDVAYRRELSAAAYDHMVAGIQTLKRSKPGWHLMLYNCNDFAADVARSIGLRVPSTLQPPDNFVRDLDRMNRPGEPRRSSF